ncbi:hypothetical protein [Chitinophaga sancti]|uniref:hypothetical protein n=1 Tax=Chitinophaga sancti TaxID=1004 RepID=UPI003F78DA8C
MITIAKNFDAYGASSSFLQYVFKNSTNRKFILLAFIAGLVQLTIFKILYPFPDFISDSYSYIDTNLYHMNVNLWPIGYSKFIAFIHLFTSSHVVLVYIQYLILLVTFLYFFFSVLYLYGLPRRFALILYVFLFFNPMFLVLANCVLSDAIFCSISLILFTQYLWMYYKPTLANLIFQALLIGAAFVIRYTAIYYPIVSICAILLATYKWPVKLIGMVLPWLLIFPFIWYTQQETKKLTGTAEFSVFGGWQIANNALYMYGNINVDSTQLPPGTVELDREARAFWKATPPTENDLAELPGTFFIKVPTAILKPYLSTHGWANLRGAPGGFQAWGSVSPVYNAYGKWLIGHYPLAFARYYMWLNVKNYFIPHLEKFGSYNIGMREVWDPAKIWFNMKSNEVTLIPSIEFQGHVFFIFPLLFMALNIFFTGCAIFFLTNKKLRQANKPLFIALLLAIAFLLINFGFSVFATPVVLRYQIVPMIVLLTFILLLTEKQFEAEN